MTDAATEKKKRGWIARYWGKATAVALVLSAFLIAALVGLTDTIPWIERHWGKTIAVALGLTAFLSWYVAMRNKGRLFLCDVAALVGLRDAIPFCRDADAPPDETDQLALLEYLKARKDQLSPERLEQLSRLEAHFEERAFAVLMKAAGIAEAPVDTRAEADTREAVRETVEEGDSEERRALAMIAEGDLDGGLRLLSDLASVPALENAEQWRRIGRLAYAVDTARALDAYEKVIALNQSDPWDAIYLGRLYRRAGALAEARRTYEEALDRLPETEERDRGVLLSEIGDVLVDQGDLAGALESYRASLAIAERLAAADPNSAGWQHDLSVSHNKIGDVLVDQGDLSGALESYRASHAIFERLTAADPNNAGWQRDLSVSHDRIGDVLVDQGDLSGALESYRASHAIAERLAAADPNNAGWQRDLSVSNERLGDIYKAQGDLDAALWQYQASLNRMVPIRDADPSNADLQRFASVTHNKIGDVLVDQGDLSGALESCRVSLAIRERLTAADPNNAGWQRDLSVSHEKIGDLEVARGDIVAAITAHEKSAAIAQSLADRFPGHPQFQSDAAITDRRLTQLRAKLQ